MKDHLNSWLRTYHQALVKSLVIFGYPESTYPFAKLKKDFQRARYIGIIMNIIHSAVSMKARPHVPEANFNHEKP